MSLDPASSKSTPSAGKSRTVPLFFAAASGLLVLVLVFLTPSLFLRPKVQQGFLLNGAPLRLIGAEYGTQFHAPQRAVDPLMTLLPGKWQRALGWSPGFLILRPLARTNLCFWMEASGSVNPAPVLQYLLVDREGFEAAMIFDGPNGIRQLAGFGPPRLADVCATPVFPRQGKTVRLRVVQPRPDGSRYDVAEFVVPNPAQADAPTWPSSPMPIEVSVGAKRFILKQARVGTPNPKLWQDPTGDWQGRWAEFRFQVKETDRTSWGWEVSRIELMDATGNQSILTGKGRGSLNGRLSYAEGEDVVVVHRWMLWSDEPAWRMRVHFENGSGDKEVVEYTFRPEFLAPTRKP